MIIVTNDTIAGYQVVQALGLVRGSTARSRNIFKDWVAGFRNIVGGEVNEYTRLQAQSREQALQRMVEEAQRLGADAIIETRMASSMIDKGVSEILMYGTAVKLAPLHQQAMPRA